MSYSSLFCILSTINLLDPQAHLSAPNTMNILLRVGALWCIWRFRKKRLFL